MCTKSALLLCLAVACLGLVAQLGFGAPMQPAPGNRLASKLSTLHKRSLCNTFGGCGAKRSYISNEDLVEERRSSESDNSLAVEEILDDIMMLLRRQQNQQQLQLQQQQQQQQALLDNRAGANLASKQLPIQSYQDDSY